MHKLPVDVSRFWAQSEREINNHCFYLRYRDLSEDARRVLVGSLQKYSRLKTIKRMGADEMHQALDYLNVIILHPGWINHPVSCAQGFNCWTVDRLSRAILTLHAKKAPDFERVKRILHESVCCVDRGGYYCQESERNPAWADLAASLGNPLNNQSGVTVSMEAVERRYQF